MQMGTHAECDGNSVQRAAYRAVDMRHRRHVTSFIATRRAPWDREAAGAARAAGARSPFDRAVWSGRLNLLNRQSNTTVRPEPFDFAQDRLVEGRCQGFDKLSPNGI